MQKYDAPYTGAWIVILYLHMKCIMNIDAPYTGAWIVINILIMKIVATCDAPYTGAWIEIYYQPYIWHFVWALPTWECELKSHLGRTWTGTCKALPMREREL